MYQITRIYQNHVTDYTYIDPRKDISPIKKVIGQQVIDVYPQAVTLGTDTINDIMRNATINYSIVHLTDHKLQLGDRVELIFEQDNSTGIFDVLGVTQDTFTINSENNGGVFVIGKEVDDFHHVDYDAISMLTVSAMQEQQRMIQEQQDTIEKLKSAICIDNQQLDLCN